ncbi:MAG: N-acetylmuramoyl-L-alanine amidase [Actinomycetes bacterium]
MSVHGAALRRGDRGPRVRAVRSHLLAAGFATRAAGDDDVFDSDLEAAVRAFQQVRGLSADGIVGPQTTIALDAARWSLGDRILRYLPGHLQAGDDVVELQERLLELGLYAGRPDGIFGPQTEAAVRELQRSVALPPDGTCGPDTLRALRQVSRTARGGDSRGLREHEWVATSGSSLVGRVVVLDPGHGGEDPGACGYGLREADLVLDLAQRLEGRLAASGVTAVLTRGSDQNPDDRERARLASEVDADVFISLHCDSTGGEGQGVASFYWGRPDGRHASVVGRKLAGLVQREILARTDLVDCRVHPRGDELLRLTRMPAVRVELGYLSHAGDAKRLGDPAFRDGCAEALLAAVQRLFLPEDADVVTGTLRLQDLRARLAQDGLG